MRSRLHNVRETVAALRAALLAPSIEASALIDTQMPALHQAALTLQQLRSGAAGSGSRQELEALARELRAAGKLIAQALALTQGMARLLAPDSGYRQDGEAAPLTPSGTVLLRG